MPEAFEDPPGEHLFFVGQNRELMTRLAKLVQNLRNPRIEDRILQAMVEIISLQSRESRDLGCHRGMGFADRSTDQSCTASGEAAATYRSVTLTSTSGPAAAKAMDDCCAAMMGMGRGRKLFTFTP